MNPIWVIAKREINAYFNSMVAFILIIAFLILTGYFTWFNSNADIFFRKQADLQIFFNIAYFIFLIFIPALTMRQLAEEKKTGTIELLLTKAVSNRQIVLGKFVACLTIIGATLLFTIPYYITVSNIGNIDHGATISGYLGLLLIGAALTSIGLFASSITNNQIVAFLIALFINLIFFFIFSFLAQSSTGIMGSIFDTLSIQNHYDSISRGLIDTKDLIYFASIIILGLLLAELNISKRG